MENKKYCYLDLIRTLSSLLEEGQHVVYDWDTFTYHVMNQFQLDTFRSTLTGNVLSNFFDTVNVDQWFLTKDDLEGCPTPTSGQISIPIGEYEYSEWVGVLQSCLSEEQCVIYNHDECEFHILNRSDIRSLLSDENLTQTDHGPTWTGVNDCWFMTPDVFSDLSS